MLGRFFKKKRDDTPKVEYDFVQEHDGLTVQRSATEYSPDLGRTLTLGLRRSLPDHWRQP